MRHVVRRHVEGCVGAAGGVVGGEPHEGQHVGYVGSRLGDEGIGGTEHRDRSVVVVMMRMMMMMINIFVAM